MARSRGRRIAVGTIIGVVVVGVLGIGAVVADGLVRDEIEKQSAVTVRDYLGLDASAPVDTRLGGWSALVQLATGRLEVLDVSADDIALGTLTGSATAHLEGVPLGDDPDGRLDSGTVDVAIDAASVASISDEFSRGTVSDVVLEDPEVRFGTELSALGLTLRLGIGVVPSVVDGDIAFTPESVTIQDTTTSADDLRERFGSLVDPLLTTGSYCVADRIPAGLALTSADVEGGALRIGLVLDPAIVGTPALQEPGTC